MADASTDHDAIRQWAEKHGAVPAAVKSTHTDDDVGLIRLMHPDAPNSHHDNLVEIEWDEFFEKFEEGELALIMDPKSNFSKLVKRHD